MPPNDQNELPKDLVQTLIEKLGASIPQTPFSSLKYRVIKLYHNAFLESELNNTDFYIEGKVTSQLRFHRGTDSVTFYIMNKDGEKISVYVPSKNNLLNHVRQGNIVGLKGKLHFYKDGIVNGYDYIQFRADEVRNIGEIRKDYGPLLRYVRANKKRKALKFMLKKDFTIALITSDTSEAILDIEKNLGHKRFFKIEKHFVNLYNPEEIANKICIIDQMNYDGILIARGGLNKVEIFNDYRILNAIFKCNTVVMTAIGHASFNSLSDIVADYSFDTPSVAALKLNNEKNDYNRKRNYLITFTVFVMLSIIGLYLKLNRLI